MNNIINIDNSNRKDIWPNFFIVGTVKGGTTSLYNHLRNHQQVFIPKFKEPHYFAQINPSKDRLHLLEFIVNQKDYLNLYKSAGQYSAIGDASTSYLWSPEAPFRIYEKIPNAKIIILLRDPVIRAHSHYLMDFREGVNNDLFSVEMLQHDFEKSKDGFGVSYLYVDMGLYYKQVKRYLEIFGAEHVLILEFNELEKNPRNTLDKVSNFLEIDNQLFENIEINKVYNEFKAPRGTWARKCAAHPWARWIGYNLMSKNLQWWLYQNIILKSGEKPTIESGVRHYLESVYEPDIISLENLIGKKLYSLRGSW